MNAIDMGLASLETVTAQAMDTAKLVKVYFHHVKLDKLQQLHDSESCGPRNEQIEQEQEQKELEEISDMEETSENEEDSDTEDNFIQGAGKTIIDTAADMFGSLEPVDNEIIQSVLEDLEEEEDDSFYPAVQFDDNEINE